MQRGPTTATLAFFTGFLVGLDALATWIPLFVTETLPLNILASLCGALLLWRWKREGHTVSSGARLVPAFWFFGHVALLGSLLVLVNLSSPISATGLRVALGLMAIGTALVCAAALAFAPFCAKEYRPMPGAVATLLGLAYLALLLMGYPTELGHDWPSPLLFPLLALGFGLALLTLWLWGISFRVSLLGAIERRRARQTSPTNLQLLEARFLKGEVSEATYLDLRRKFETE